ncbi:hypothetical protein ATANTOWER_001405 [Ataeniobius toweri]|uniref:Uncharacterized protein n=1 Tax=Ataeniobius toweri TaxID=208326 RepID=A0ABU7AXJ6_9TELE|nr:hypothetical protein [Ataeniobius toweri]
MHEFCSLPTAIIKKEEEETDLLHAGPLRNWKERHSALMSSCRQADVTLQTGSKSAIRSCDHQVGVSADEVGVSQSGHFSSTNPDWTNEIKGKSSAAHDLTSI